MNYPGIWGEAFERWVRDGRPRDAIIHFGSRDFTLPAGQLLATLRHCDDQMPDYICGALQLPAGSTYSIAARKLHPAVPASPTAHSVSTTTRFERLSGRVS
jgi:hypothetical protein